MMELVLPCGRTALCDDEDAELVQTYSWHSLVASNGRVYVQSHAHPPLPKTIYLHRLVLGFPTGEIDHQNDDPLDNRKQNLRVCSHSQNAGNQRNLRTNKTSSYRGVYFDRRRGKWNAQIRINYKKRHLGGFSTEVEAAKAYDQAAQECWGEFARPNLEREDAWQA